MSFKGHNFFNSSLEILWLLQKSIEKFNISANLRDFLTKLGGIVIQPSITLFLKKNIVANITFKNFLIFVFFQVQQITNFFENSQFYNKSFITFVTYGNSLKFSVNIYQYLIYLL